MHEFDLDMEYTKDFELDLSFAQEQERKVLNISAMHVTVTDLMVIAAYMTKYHADEYANGEIPVSLERMQECIRTAVKSDCGIADLVANMESFVNFNVVAGAMTLTNFVPDQDDYIIMICGLFEAMQTLVNHESVIVIEYMEYYNHMLKRMSIQGAYAVMRRYIDQRV